MDVFSGKKVAIFGGGDSAVDWGLALSENATSVNVIHRRNEFRAHDHTVEELKKSSAIINTPFVPKELIGSNGKVTKVIIEDTGSKELTEIEVDDVICTFGFVSNIGPINDWGLEIENNKIKVDSMQKTNIDGIFAIGDICTYDGKASLIINGFGEGPVAINSAYKKILPDAIIGALHSSSSIGGK